ncbi:dTDP-4-dehydrorhamnose 3,5-epimerase [Escherichia coli]|nr:dTDP-4-dehydrorhamnose 3,5-epimerase [Escherichia coli]EJA1050436.1 dTDP-4-dehydrorhamnose 3,5-epimerase [Escherichia coli]EJG8156500.1 dTDP-4-dehydrorhamnose 3,5-epimerase [Escherichia coli]ELR8773062.1 dTDP-4-dehydrorhamnose 3,5-epimerase [Escherichia coli]
MNVIQTPLKDCVIIEPKVFGDSRGFFLEAWHKEKYENAGIKGNFVQDNRSRSSRNVLRGLHFQKAKPQGKLVSVISGEVYDVAVDLRHDSETFGQYVSVLLSGKKNNQLYVPPGFAHGFCVLSEYADFHYKCTDFYDPKDEGGIIWNDPDIAIDWPVTEPLLSEKDIKLITLAEYKKSL